MSKKPKKNPKSLMFGATVLSIITIFGCAKHGLKEKAVVKEKREKPAEVRRWEKEIPKISEEEVPKKQEVIEERGLVALAHEATMPQSTRRAVELAGGFGFIKSGETILVKVNANSYDPHPGTTNPEVVKEVVKMAFEAGAGRVIVADRSSIYGPWSNTMYNMRRVGIERAAREAGAEVIALENTEWIHIRLEGATHWKEGFTIPRLAQEVDHIINLPVVKTHEAAVFSMSLKNFVGLISPHDRRVMHASPHLQEMIADLNLAFKPSFIVMDASRVFVTGGPARGRIKEPRIIVATRDRVAADVVGLALLKTLGTTSRIEKRSVWDQPQIRRAMELELGIPDASELKFKWESIADIERITDHALH